VQEMGACGSALDALDDELHQDDNLARDAANVFRLVDEDKSGTLSTEEFAKSKRWDRFTKDIERQKKTIILPPNPNLKQFIAFILKCDPIDAAVCLSMMEKELVEEPILQSARELFVLLDTSGDGRIDLKSEATALAGFNGGLVLADLDYSNDGEITQDEFLKGVRDGMKRSPARMRLILRGATLYIQKGVANGPVSA